MSNPTGRLLRQLSTWFFALALCAGAVVLAPPTATAAPPPAPSGNVVLDPAFTGSVNYMVYSMARQSDGKIVTWGMDFLLWRDRLTRMTATGQPDPTFVSPSFGDYPSITWVTALPDDKLLVSGGFDFVNGVPRPGVARLNANGTLDSSFVPILTGPNDMEMSGPAAVQPDGKVLITVDILPPGEPYPVLSTTVMRLTSTGAIDPTFRATLTPSDASYNPTVLAPLPDGKVLIGGPFVKVNGIGRNGIARLTATGAIDPTFNPGAGFAGRECSMCGPVRPGVGVQVLTPLPDGKVLVGGSFSVFDWFPANQLIRLAANGQRDVTFDSADGVFLQGTSSPLEEPSAARAATAAAPSPEDPLLDTLAVGGYGYPQPGEVETIGVQPDGKIVIGGAFDSYRGTQRPGIARLNPTGSVDLSFDPGAGFYSPIEYGFGGGGRVTSMVLPPTGGILVAGFFDSFDEQTALHIASLAVRPQVPTVYTPLAKPVRVFDSRKDSGPVTTTLAVDLTDEGAVELPEGANAVSVNLTITDPTSAGYATIARDDGRTYTACPATSAVNWTTAHQTISNAVVTGISGSKKLKVCIMGARNAQVIIDLTGYYAPDEGSVFVPIAPTRAYDSRTPADPLAGGKRRTIDLNEAVENTVPTAATAVAYNLTATGTTASGYLAVAPGGTTTEPGVSSLNWTRPLQTIANAAQVGVAESTVEVFAGGTGSTHLTFDVVGYFIPEAALPAGTVGLELMPIAPTRAYDSRTKDGPLYGDPIGSGVGPGRTTGIDLDGSLPASARAIAANLTATGTTGTGYLTTGPAASPVPATSNVNWISAGTTIANASITGISPTGTVTSWVGGRRTSHYIVDISGYYVPAD